MRALRLSSQQLLNLPTVTTDCLQLLSPRIWNEIPAAIRNAPTVQTFKHRLKTLLFGLNGPLHMTQPPTWRLPASQIRSYTLTLHALLVYLLQLLSASLYVSKRGVYRLCRDVVGCWSLVGCHAHALWPNGAS